MQMKRGMAALALALAVLLAVPVAASADSEAVPTPDESWYFYGDTATFEYPGELPTGWSITWAAVDSSGADVTYTQSEDLLSIVVDLTSYNDPVYVTQTVSNGSSSSSKTTEAMPLHVAEGSSTGTYLVTFMDGSSVYSTYTISRTTVVREGDTHVVVPSAPTKEGYTFGGWYWTDSDGTEHEFDATEPVTSDMANSSGVVRIDAKWIGSGGGGSSHVVIDTNVVTFQAVNGLRYDVDSVSGSSVTFTVAVNEGYEFDLSTITVGSNYGTVTSLGDCQYILTGVTRDTIVTISGDRLYTVQCRLQNASLSVSGYDSVPEYTIPGEFVAQASPSFGWSGMDIRVYMDGRDLTSLYVSGGTIDIAEVTGNLVIVAEASFPWFVLVIVIVVAAAVVAAYLYRRRLHRSRSP